MDQQRRREIWKKASQKYRANHDLKKRNAENARRWRDKNPKRARELEKKYRDSHIVELREKRLVKNIKNANHLSVYRQGLYQKWISLAISEGKNHCSKCGYNKCFKAIDFHHLYPYSKRWQISRIFKLIMTPERVEEFHKCIPLCKNCHVELHYSLERRKENV